MRLVKTYFLIAIVSVIFTLYLFEAFLLIKEKRVISKKIDSFKKNTKKNYDTRSKAEIYRDLKSKDNNITLAITSWSKKFLDKNDILPLSGLSNSKSIHCNENGYYSIYHSDRYGFNNPNKEWNETEIEYLTVGDSFVHGACVNRPNDISSVLRTLSGKSVINLGISGNGPLTEYATLREYAPKNVKNIIWIYFEGYDLTDLILEKKNDILKKYLNDESFSQELIIRNQLKDQTVKKITEIEFNRINEKYVDDNNLKYKILKFIRLDKTKKNIFTHLDISEKINYTVFNDFENIMKLTKKMSDKNNSKFYFVYLPDYLRLTEKYNDENYNRIISITQKLDISVIDLKKEMYDLETNPLKFYPFGENAHFNIMGYKKASEIIFKATNN